MLDTCLQIPVWSRSNIYCLDLTVASPDYFATAVHAGHWLLPANLDHHGAFIIAQSHTADHASSDTVLHSVLSDTHPGEQQCRISNRSWKDRLLCNQEKVEAVGTGIQTFLLGVNQQS